MRAVFKEDEEEAEDLAPPPLQQDRELTLSSATLLAIFYGLVLICAVFFGLGYTLGRHAPFEPGQLTQPAPGSLAAAPIAGGTDYSSKPSAAAHSGQPQSSPAEATPASQPDGQQDEPQTNENTADAVSTAEPKTAYPAIVHKDLAREPAPALPPTAGKPVAAQAIPAPAVSMMVQIAAVSNPADADVLVSALHKHGYTVTVRREPNDALMHVQVGPFSSRADAVAMRQKLLSDGYNAILK